MKITVLEKDSVMEGNIDHTSLDGVGEVIYYGNVPQDEVIAAIGDSDGVIVNKTKITARIMDACPNLKYVGTFATGYNNIDVAAARERGVTVCNVPGYSTQGVAQLTIAFILYTATNMQKYVSSVNRGDWKKCQTFCYYPYAISEVSGKTLGIVGYGAIGSSVATIARALGMEVIVYSRTRKHADVAYVSLDELLSRSDYISLHCPLTEQTEKLINADNIAKMKSTAVLINTARGALIDENALASALKSGAIAASCHDVIEYEPMRNDCPLYGLENCYITPHVAWAGLQTRQRLVEIAADNVQKYKAGTPQNVVN